MDAPDGLRIVVPLVIFLLAGLRQSRDGRASLYFSTERWSYADAAVVLIVYTATGALLAGRPRDLRVGGLSFVAIADTLIVLVFLAILLRLRYRCRLSAVGMRKHSLYYAAWSLRGVSATVAIAGGLVILGYLLRGGSLWTLVGDSGPRSLGSVIEELVRWAPLWWLYLIVMAPFVEELIFRGLILPPLARRWGFTGAIALTAAMFASGHAYGAYPMLHVGASFSVALVYGQLYRRTRSIVPGLVFHATLNTVAISVQIAKRLDHPIVLVLWAAIGGALAFLPLRRLVRMLEPPDSRLRLGARASQRDDPLFGSIRYMGDRLMYWEGKAPLVPGAAPVDVLIDGTFDDDMAVQHEFGRSLRERWPDLRETIEQEFEKVRLRHDLDDVEHGPGLGGFTVASVSVPRAALDEADWDVSFHLPSAYRFLTVRMRGPQPIGMSGSGLPPRLLRSERV
ncbi:MAG: CPBP family intramembrane metalloprotease [Candidatus Rokubacteria bacterium]|nr:CPBP family intramembrane metalloprotease [Candidatus Rokubacteria bacterium]